MDRINQIMISKRHFFAKKATELKTDHYKPIESDFKEFSEYVMHHKLNISLVEFLEPINDDP